MFQPTEQERALWDAMDNETRWKYWRKMTEAVRAAYRDTSELDERFTPYYQSGERVEVTYKDGSTERFYVGRSTGWRPIYITVKRRNSLGGGSIWSDGVVSIRGLGTYRLR